jgi:hypothetical protein
VLFPGASCSGGGDKALGKPTSSDSTDPCSLLTARRINASTGWTVERPGGFIVLNLKQQMQTS